MPKSNDRDVDAALRSYTAKARLRVYTSAHKPEVWAAALARLPGGLTPGHAVLVVDSDALPSDPEAHRVLLIPDQLSKEAVDAFIARAVDIFDREIDSGMTSVGWMRHPDGTRTFIFVDDA